MNKYSEIEKLRNDKYLWLCAYRNAGDTVNPDDVNAVHDITMACRDYYAQCKYYDDMLVAAGYPSLLK